jgi:hypothetical protein
VEKSHSSLILFKSDFKYDIFDLSKFQNLIDTDICETEIDEKEIKYSKIRDYDFFMGLDNSQAYS